MSERCGWCWKIHRGLECLHGVLLVCGGRDFDDLRLMWTTLDRVADRMEITAVRHGDARGADRMAEDWAHARGYPVDPCPADWDTWGHMAGPIRNRRMARKEPRPVACVAFTPGPSGTYHMVGLCERLGIPVWRVGWLSRQRSNLHPPD